nr:ferritin family protein [Thermococcus sp. 21S7]
MLSYWIGAEIDEAEMYNALAKKAEEYSWDSRVAALFRALAKESLNHAESLLTEYRQIYGGDALVDSDVPSIEVELSSEELEEYVRSGRLSDLIEVLMEGEKIARDIYAYMAERASGSLRETLLKLSEIEDGHYSRLARLREELLRGG